MQVRTITAAAAAVAALGAGVAIAPSALASSGAKKEYFTLVQEQGKTVVVAHGAFDAATTKIKSNDTDDTYYFKHGTITISHPAKDAKYKEHIDSTTCYATFAETGKFTFTKGTGAYKHIKGSGTYKGSDQAVLPKKNGTCDDNSDPKASYFLVNAKGKVTL